MVRGLAKMREIEVIDAATVADAERLIHASQPSLLLTDLDLPDGTGLDLMSILDAEGLQIPLLFLSAYTESFQKRIPQRSTVTVREKPLSITELRSFVQDTLCVGRVQTSSPFSVADYIQLACLGGRSVVLDVQDEGERIGEICIMNGELWSSFDRQGSGTEAFRRLAFGASAERSMVQVRVPTDSGPSNLSEPWQVLMLDSARMLDEGTLDLADDADVTPLGEETRLAPFSFEALMEEVLEAFLAKDYPEAERVLCSAKALRPDDSRVQANLSRLEELGYRRSRDGEGEHE